MSDCEQGQELSLGSSCVIALIIFNLVLPLHRCVISTVYSVLSRKKNPQAITQVGFEPTTVALLEQMSLIITGFNNSYHYTVPIKGSLRSFGFFVIFYFLLFCSFYTMF